MWVQEGRAEGSMRGRLFVSGTRERESEAVGLECGRLRGVAVDVSLVR